MWCGWPATLTRDNWGVDAVRLRTPGALWMGEVSLPPLMAVLVSGDGPCLCCECFNIVPHGRRQGFSLFIEVSRKNSYYQKKTSFLLRPVRRTGRKKLLPLLLPESAALPTASAWRLVQTLRRDAFFQLPRVWSSVGMLRAPNDWVGRAGTCLYSGQ